MALELRGNHQLQLPHPVGMGGVKQTSPSGSSSTSSCKSGVFGITQSNQNHNSGGNTMQQNQLITEKRNRLKEIAAEELGLQKTEEKSPE
jgi:hypothetical protein